MYIAVGIITAFVLIAYGIRTILTAGESEVPAGTSHSPGEEHVNEEIATMEVMSQLWKRHDARQAALSELRKIWRKDSSQARGGPGMEPALYVHREVRDFYHEHVSGKPFFIGQVLAVTHELLRLLDTKGKCPSVVNTQREPERKFDADTYRQLKKIPLYEHSVNVAREVITHVPDGPMVPKAVIAALSHDIGKIPEYHSNLYATADHAFIAVSVLERVPGFHSLKYAAEVMDAVKNHHASPESLLGKALKESDQEARRKEVAELKLDMAQEVVRPKGRPPGSKGPESVQMLSLFSDMTQVGKQVASPFSDSSVSAAGYFGGPPSEDSVAALTGAAEPKKVDLIGSESKPVKLKREKIPLPWLNLDDLLAGIRKIINVPKGSQWSAISMPDGVIYVRPDVVLQISNEMSPDHPDFLKAQVDDGHRYNILYTIVEELRSRGAIDEKQLRKGQFRASYTVTTTNGPSTPTYFIPLRCQTWGLTALESETGKTGVLLRVKSISPYVKEKK